MGSYFLRPAGHTYAPRHLVVVVPDAIPAADTEGPSVPMRATRFAVVAHRRRKHQWLNEDRRWIDSGPELHDWLEEWSYPKSTTYVVSPRVGPTLTLSDFWHRCESRGCHWSKTRPVNSSYYERTGRLPAHTIRTLCLRNTPDIVHYTINGRSIRWCSGRQYLTASEDELADWVGYDFPRTGRRSELRPKVIHDAGERAILWSLVMRHLVDWWLKIDGGPWGSTAGQLAWTYFRRHVRPRTILVHDRQPAKELELGAITAGRASVWYVGDVSPADGRRCDRPDAPPPSRYGSIPGPVSLFDVRSLYPWLLASQVYPVKLLRWGKHYGLRQIEGLLTCRCVVARVTLSARRPEYPCKWDGRIRFPVGPVTTTLAGPELHRALRDDEIRTVHEAAIYTQGRPFRETLTTLLELRQDARRRENPAWEECVKLLSNSLSGKFAQRRGAWVARPLARVPITWGEHVSINAATGIVTRYRVTAGLVEQWVEDTLGGRPLGSCYAYLTSYARCLMRSLREQLPERTVVSQDTDGLWVLPAGRRVLESIPGAVGSTPGTLRYERSSDWGRWHDPKHYWTDRGWVLSGFHEFQHFAAENVFRDTYTQNPVLGAPQCPDPVVWHRTRDSHLSSLPVDGEVQPDGWIEPSRLTGRWAVPRVTTA